MERYQVRRLKGTRADVFEVRDTWNQNLNHPFFISLAAAEVYAAELNAKEVANA